MSGSGFGKPGGDSKYRLLAGVPRAIPLLNVDPALERALHEEASKKCVRGSAAWHGMLSAMYAGIRIFKEYK